MLYLFFTILGFALGSTLFAYWTPKIIRHIDIRELPADHNPGVANAFMYGGFFCGLLSLILEGEAGCRAQKPSAVSGRFPHLHPERNFSDARVVRKMILIYLPPCAAAKFADAKIGDAAKRCGGYEMLRRGRGVFCGKSAKRGYLFWMLRDMIT